MDEGPEHYIATARRIDREIATLAARYERDREVLLARRRYNWMRANRAGMTYAAIREATGYSDGLICREVAKAVREAGEPRAPRGNTRTKVA